MHFKEIQTFKNSYFSTKKKVQNDRRFMLICTALIIFKIFCIFLVFTTSFILEQKAGPHIKLLVSLIVRDSVRPSLLSFLFSAPLDPAAPIVVVVFGTSLP